MPKDFCYSCGFANEFTLQKPLFCGGCGSKMNILQSNIIKAAPKSSIIPNFEVEVTDTGDSKELAAKFELEEPIERPRRGIKLQDLINQPKNPDFVPRPTQKGKKINAKKFTEEFMKQAQNRPRESMYDDVSENQ